MLLSVLCAVSFANAVEGRVDKFVHVPVQRQLKLSTSESRHIKRADDWFEATFSNRLSAYTISLDLGTPPQPVSLVIDTDNGDTTVLGPGSTCRSFLNHTNCGNFSVFDAEKSKTFSKNSSISDSNGREGQWGQDTASFGNLTIENFNFGYFTEGSYQSGFAGLGLRETEELADDDKSYPNLPLQMKINGDIDYAAYSLWLNAQSTQTGSLLFGAIDKAKFLGDLYTVPVVPSPDDDEEYDGFSIPFEGVSVINGDNVEQRYVKDHERIYILSASPVSRLPSYMLEGLLPLLGATFLPDSEGISGYWEIECDELLNSEVEIGILVGDLEIRVPFRELGFPIDIRNNTEYCIPGFLLDETTPSIGANILRKLYMVFDLEALEVGIATAKTGDDLDEDFEVLSTGIPGKKAPGYSDSTYVGEELAVPITILGRNTLSEKDYTTFASTSFSNILGGTNATADNALRTAFSTEPSATSLSQAARSHSSNSSSRSSSGADSPVGASANSSDSSAAGASRISSGNVQETGQVSSSRPPTKSGVTSADKGSSTVNPTSSQSSASSAASTNGAQEGMSSLRRVFMSAVVCALSWL